MEAPSGAFLSETVKTVALIVALFIAAIVGGLKLLGMGTKMFIDGKITTGTQDRPALASAIKTC
ncbi:MAG: hypothetical protein Q8T11_14965 [Elusimicrobiota bacterium]|nr:hypothetical protein [Elusimicrobiota bacterium]